MKERKNKILVIIPAYNEAENIVHVVNHMLETAPQYDYLVVNDRLDDCVAEIHSIIESEHRKIRYNMELVNRVREELRSFSKGE